MRILVFGRVGQLGTALAELLDPLHETIFLDQPEIDLSAPDSVVAHVREHAPDLVVNAAAYTAVDKAETEPDLADAINAQAPGAMALACADAKIPLLHYSTDYVFDGSASAPYRENAPVNPRSVYGRGKLAGEQAVAQAIDQHVILRTAWLYSYVGHNFLKTMLRLAAEGKSVRVVDDQIGSPTYAWDLAQASAAVVEALAQGRDDIYGIFHATNAGVTSWHGFAERIFDLAGYDDVELVAISTDEYPTPAPRPAYSVLCCERLQEAFGVTLPEWPDALARCIARL